MIKKKNTINEVNYFLLKLGFGTSRARMTQSTKYQISHLDKKINVKYINKKF